MASPLSRLLILDSLSLTLSCLQARIQAAQYAHLPLCNFGADWVVDTCDALYARQLREAGQLLWAADPTQPDLASRPEDLAEAATLQEQHRATQVGLLLLGGWVAGSRRGWVSFVYAGRWADGLCSTSALRLVA